MMWPFPRGIDHSSALLRLNVTMSIARIITVRPSRGIGLPGMRAKPQHPLPVGGMLEALTAQVSRQHP